MTLSMHATTIVCVKKEGRIAIAGDGQVTLGNSIVKGNAHKVRKLYKGQVITGFAGAVADAFSLYDLFEKKLEEFDGDLLRACVELTSKWRTDKYLRRLEAMLIVANVDNVFLLSGSGEVIEPEESILAIGSGGDFARSAALALARNTKLPANEIAVKALQIAGDICIYTNNNITVEQLWKRNKNKNKT